VKRYEVLFIDLDDTLYDFSYNSREVYRTVYGLLDYQRWFDSFEHYYAIYWEYNQQLWARYNDGEITKDELNAERYTHPLRVAGVAEADAVGALFWAESMKRLPLGKRLMPNAREVLEYLRPKYRLYILSNGFVELQSRKMQSADIAHYFDGMVLSEDIGVNKPHPEIFMHALKVAGVAPEKALMIGDNREADVRGAQAVGIDQVYYNVSRTPWDEGAEPPTYTIDSLLQLKDIV
jgi:putative hydrolase of the HAD superfamily